MARSHVWQHGHWPMQLAALLVAALGIAAAVSLLLWCLAGQVMARLLRSGRQSRIVNRLLALILAPSVAPRWLEIGR